MKAYCEEVRQGKFPVEEHCYRMLNIDWFCWDHVLPSATHTSSLQGFEGDYCPEA